MRLEDMSFTDYLMAECDLRERQSKERMKQAEFEKYAKEHNIFYCAKELQEPCDDAVSRQAVEEIINDIRDCISVEGYWAILERLKKLPSVRPQEPKWIPVSERLPEDSYGCLVTVYDTDLITQEEFENILPYFVGYDGETWNNADGEPIPFEVVAWMPLPEPYKADMRGAE